MVALSGLCDRPAVDPVGQVYRVPYRMSETMHILVRVKFNGAGPFHFIIDTGAPAIFVRTEAANRAGAQRDADGWTRFDRMEIEGGLQLQNVPAIVEDIFQLRGMNGLGLAANELDGVIGYTLLSKFRMDFDLSRNSMTWTRLDFEPPLPGRLGGGSAPPELEALGGFAQGLGGMLGRNVRKPPVARGLIGLELEDSADGVRVTAVLPKGPADLAGVRVGDVVSQLSDKSVGNALDARKISATYPVGKPVKLAVQRGGERLELTVTTVAGF